MTQLGWYVQALYLLRIQLRSTLISIVVNNASLPMGFDNCFPSQDFTNVVTSHSDFTLFRPNQLDSHLTTRIN